VKENQSLQAILNNVAIASANRDSLDEAKETRLETKLKKTGTDARRSVTAWHSRKSFRNACLASIYFWLSFARLTQTRPSYSK